jgi:hypothetical protein
VKNVVAFPTAGSGAGRGAAPVVLVGRGSECQPPNVTAEQPPNP